MRDPHVETLHYELVPSERTSFSAPPLVAERSAFKLQLADGHLTVEMREHYASESEARDSVDPFLRAWEIQHALWAGSAEIHFKFERSKIIERDPPQPGAPQTIELSSIVHGRAIVGATLSVTRGSYPAPPTDFEVSPDVETLWQRWEGYVGGREPLQGMAFFCLTVLRMHGGQAGASKRFGISTKILRTLSYLASETGDAATARKATPNLRPISGEERAWLEAAVKALVRRVGEVAADPGAARPQLTMGDLPSL
jgi:hypothetical protein